MRLLPRSAPRFMRPVRRQAATAATALGLALGGLTGAAWAQQPAAKPASAPAGPTVRAEFAKPLAAAQEQLRAANYRDALARIAEAEALPAPSPYERYLIARLKASASLGAGDAAAAMPLFEQLLGDDQLPSVDRNVISETLIRLSIQQKDFARAARSMKAYLDGGGPDAEIRRLYPQVLLQQGDHAGAAAAFATQLAADDAAGRAPTEQLLRMLASAQGQAGQDGPYLATLKRLAASTGKAEYWNELIVRTARADGFAGERLRLDIYRLRRAAGLNLSAGELGDMAYRANQAGLPAEAQKLLDEGFNSKLLGNDANAAADRKLREGATKAAAQDRASVADSEAALRSAKDGNAAYGLGLALSGAGLHDKAVALIQQGITKGGLRRPNDAVLHLGLAQWRAGQQDEALKTFASVGGNDGTAELAQLWVLLLRSPAGAAKPAG